MSKRNSQQMSSSNSARIDPSSSSKGVSSDHQQQQAIVVDLPLPPHHLQLSEKQLFSQQLDQRRKEFNDQLQQEMDEFLEQTMENRVMERLQPKLQVFQQKITELQMQNHLMATKVTLLEQIIATRSSTEPLHFSLPTDMTLEQFITMQRNRAASVPPPQLSAFPPTLPILLRNAPPILGGPYNNGTYKESHDSSNGQNGSAAGKPQK